MVEDVIMTKIQEWMGKDREEKYRNEKCRK